MQAIEVRKAIQRWLQMDVIDGIFGPKTLKAFRDLAQTPAEVPWPEMQRKVWATSFADPKDIAAFQKCLLTGKTEKQCLAVGDNGIGTPKLGTLNDKGKRLGVDTTQNKPMCALPPEDWEPLGDGAPGALVEVVYKNRHVVCELRDTMRSKEKIDNDAGIDLNPAACKALGLTPPVKAEVTWRWV